MGFCPICPMVKMIATKNRFTEFSPKICQELLRAKFFLNFFYWKSYHKNQEVHGPRYAQSNIFPKSIMIPILHICIQLYGTT